MSLVPLGRKYGTVQTVGVEVKDVAGTVTIPTGASFLISGELFGTDAATKTTVRAMVRHSGQVIAGVLALDGSLSTLLAMAGAAALVGALVDVVASGATAKLQVTGVVLKTIDWDGWLDVYLRQ